MKDSIQEGDSIQKFEDSVHEESRGTINENQEQFSEDVEESHRVDTKRLEDKSSLEQNQYITIRGNLGSKMGLIRKRANNKFCDLEFNKQ